MFDSYVKYGRALEKMIADIKAELAAKAVMPGSVPI